MFEMRHNSEVLDKMGLGEYCDSPYDSYLRAINFARSSLDINKQVYLASHLRMDGILATGQLISSGIPSI
jgi:hypothetical protein